MNKWLMLKKSCLAFLCILSIAIPILAFNQAFQAWWSEISLAGFVFFPSLILFLIIFTFDIGGRYVLYCFVIAAAYVASTAAGWTAGMHRGENIIEIALMISIPSLFLLIICVVILVRKYIGRKNT